MDKQYGHKNDKKKWHYSKNKNSQQNENSQHFQQNHEEEIPLPKVQLKAVNCEYCNKPIEDLACALASKENGNPVHFDCVIEKISQTEKLLPEEKVTYIGQGRFGVVVFENPNDLRHFSIKRIIEWENRDKPNDWRKEITDIYDASREK